jgi:mono/diheme cytochrome c family protein
MVDDTQNPSDSAPPTGGSGALKWMVLGAAVFVIGLVALCVMMMGGSSSKATGAPLDALPAGYVGNAATGAKLYMQSCASCHGPRGHGMPHQGLTLRQSVYVSELSDLDLVQFLRHGRTADDPTSAMKLPMPAKGNNPNLTDVDLMDIVAHMRTLQAEAGYTKN